ncbi:MAG: hypothetical protein HY791_40220 [Deltaproteobacteria bacterium]|nr:hypothetical protein [Deltaproteobacteria bacterium]
MGRRAAWALLLLSVSCAGVAGKKHFSEGKRLDSEGDADAAIVAYRRAVEASPGANEYREVLEARSKARARAHVEKARSLEKKGKHGDAAKAWKQALELDPRSLHLKVRLEVAEARAAGDPLAIVLALEEWVRIAPKDKSAPEELEEARASAIKALEAEADSNLSVASGAAFASYEKLRKIDPTHAVFSGAKYRAAKARHFEAVGDAKQKAGDGLGALDAYQEAVRSATLPGLEQKLLRAKRSAGSLLEQLEQARAHERLEEWEDAAELYTVIRERPDAPSDVAAKAKSARDKSARLRLERAKDQLEKGALDKARAELMLALEHTDAAKAEIDQITSAMSELASSRLGEARRALSEKLTSAVAQAARQLLAASARSMFVDAERLSTNDPARAFLLVRELRPFASSLPKLQALEAALTPKAFTALLDRAEPLATMGALREAAEMIAAALSISKPPKEMAEKLAQASLALTSGDSAKAYDGFSDAARTDPRSRLAAAGQRVARAARLAELAIAAKDPRADASRVAAAWREVLVMDPENNDAKLAIARLGPELVKRALASAQAQKTAGRPATALVYVARALSIDPESAEAKGLRAEIAQKIPPAGSVFGYVAKLPKPPTGCAEIVAELRPAIVLYMTKTRGLLVPFLGAQEHAAIDEGRAPPSLVELAIQPTECLLSLNTGEATARLTLKVAGAKLLSAQVVGAFDPSGLPKDEAAPTGPELAKATAAAIAKEASAAVLNAGSQLGDWRASWARAVMSADDVEGSSRAFLALEDAARPEEKSARRDLEAYLARRLP